LTARPDREILRVARESFGKKLRGRWREPGLRGAAIPTT
jgi:hypothetical protein